VKITLGTASCRGDSYVGNKLCYVRKNGCYDAGAEVESDVRDGIAGCADVDTGCDADAEEGCEDDAGGLDSDWEELEIASVAGAWVLAIDELGGKGWVNG
jgi:hypothetical protein